MEDDRFKTLIKEAKFRRVPKRVQKVKIDSRFQSMFKDKKFKEEFDTDKRGRPIKHSTKRDLKRYYHISSSDESSSDSEDENRNADINNLHKSEPPNINETVSADVKKKLKNLKVDYARGEQSLFSESSSDNEGSEAASSADEEDSIDHKWGELDAEAETTEDVTQRLAACNMDWDRIRAVDIMVLMNSFLPVGGTIQNVKIYLSEFGKKRLKEEDISGPPELKDSKLDDGDEDTEEGSKYHMEKLRQYQLNRLKYYYAVITFSDAATANKVYTECDGMEYESSATKIDLRFIPDEMEFDENPKEICDKMPDMDKYQPRFFITTALQQAKVKLTWDETNPDRIEITQKINKGELDDVDEVELQNYIAFSDEDSGKSEEIESDTNDENPIDKYKALLVDIEEKEKEKKNKDVQMEVTWGLELEKKSEELVKKKLAEKEEKTPFQKYLDKKKEKRKEKKKSKKNTQVDSNKNEGDDIPSDVDMNDPYFAEEFTNSDFQRKKNKFSDKSDQKDNEEDLQKHKELELLLMNNESEERKHFSLKKIQLIEERNKNPKKNKKAQKLTEVETENSFKVDVSDARFSAIFSSHHFNIDPSNSHYKKTEGMEALIKEKQKRRAEDTNVNLKKNKADSQSRKNAELQVLVKSIKRNAKSIKIKK